MIRKSAKRFSEKTMRKQHPEARWQLKPTRLKRAGPEHKLAYCDASGFGRVSPTPTK